MTNQIKFQNSFFRRNSFFNKFAKCCLKSKRIVYMNSIPPRNHTARTISDLGNCQLKILNLKRCFFQRPNQILAQLQHSLLC